MDFILGGLIVIGVIVFSMVLHELAHGAVAYYLGDTTAKDDGRLTLNPLKHLDPFMSIILPTLLYFSGGVVFGGAKPVPVDFSKVRGREWGMALVALAGPMTNLLIAFVAFLIGHFSGALYYSGIVHDILLELVMVNLGFMIFNLIPIPPLDGSRVLYAVMPDGVREFMNSMEKVGLVVVYALILIGGGLFSEFMSRAIYGVFNGFYWIIGA
ncbi:site-2 protease family protein [Candidatus Saccharibacteria bacterium]|nr:site-2 protease family protein [Candidatus Saccharibacteria bacterium]